MSTQTPSASAQVTPPVPDLGHPVRSFSLVMVAVGILLLALQWTGAVYPNLESPRGSSTDFAGVDHVLVEIHNAGALPVRIEDATWPVTGGSAGRLGLAPPAYPEGPLDLADIPPFRPVTIDAHSSRWLVLTVLAGCQTRLGEPTVEVRTALGLRRTVDLLGEQGQTLSSGC
ncbi:MAG: hypothetical protein ABL966_14720 [Acidimicrobiales bacterium]